MSKRNKLKKTNPKKSLRTAKEETVSSLNATCDAARNNKEQRHTPDGVCEQSTKNYGILRMKKSKNRTGSTKCATNREFQDNNKVAEDPAIADNQKFADNTSNSNYKDMQMQGAILRAVVNFDQSNNKTVKKVDKQNKIVLRKEKVEQTGKVEEIHENLELNSDGTSDIHSKDIQDNRRIPNIGDDNFAGRNMMLTSCTGNIKEKEDLIDKKKIAEEENVASKKHLESFSTKKVGKK